MLTGCYTHRPLTGRAKEEQQVRIHRAEGFLLLQPNSDLATPWLRCRAATAIGRVVNSSPDTLRLVGLSSVKWVGENPGCGTTDEFRVVYADSPGVQVERMEFRPLRTLGMVLITLYAIGHVIVTYGTSGGLS